MLPQILIIEDNDLERGLYSRVLKSEGHQVLEAQDLKKAREIMQRQVVHVAILDVNLPDGNGMDFISELKRNQPAMEIIVFTARGSIEGGVNSIKQGAFDYIVKGEAPTKLISMVERATAIAYEKFLANLKQSKTSGNTGFAAIIGESAILQKAKDMALRVAGTNANVLLLGETGVGKDLFAEAIHQASHRKDQPFIAINCSAIGQEMLESELFGYKAGAFTGAVKDKKGIFEMADKGTIFLDEIGEMGINLQSRILRVLQNKNFIKLGDTKTTSVDCRLIAATNVDLMLGIKAGTFREDLYYRISSFIINIPPLRDREEDAALLVKHFASILPSKLGLPSPEITASFVRTLASQMWKGNVRELINVVERAIILSDGILTTELLELPKRKPNSGIRSLENAELAHIKDVLEECGGNKRETARRLGISITTLYRKLDGEP